MTLRDCIAAAVAHEDMDPVRAQSATELFDALETEYAASMGPDAAASMAARETVSRLEAEMTEQARQKLIAAMTHRRILRDLSEYRRADGAADRNEAALGLIDGVGLSVKSPSAEQTHKVIRGRAHGLMSDVLATFRRTMVGQTREPARLVNLVREAFGEKTGDVAAAELVKGWRAAAEFLRLQFNEAGGHIGTRDDWGLPQSHDSQAVRQTPYEEWRDFILPKLDPARMIDGATGKAFTAAELRGALKGVYDAIRTEGFSRIEPSGAGGGKALANRRADHRFLVFSTADDWLAYQARFGEGDPFNAMMGHVDGMSRDIGALRALGPNPNTTIRYVQQLLKKEALEGTDEQAIKAADGTAKKLETLYGTYTGAYNSPVNSTWARSLSTVRQLLVSAQLGGAAISAISDLAFQRLTKNFVGIPQAKIVGQIAKLLNPFDAQDRVLAVRLGLVAEEWSHRAAAQQRYVGEAVSGEVASRLSDFVLRASGLSAWTQAGRWAFGMEFMGALADNAGHKFADLNPALSATLMRYGINESGWDIIRATAPYADRGATFLRPDDLAARAGGDLDATLAEDLTTRFLSMIQSETEFAVPATSLRARAAFNDRTRPGTIGGEILRSGLMYKNFSITLLYTHLRRMADAQGGWNKARYAANLIIGGTIMGALAVQMKEVAKGRDPRPMDNPAFWGAALLQGGGIGIFGDFLNSSTNRFGGGLASTLAGPPVALLGDATQLTVGNVNDVLHGRDAHVGRDAVNFARRYTPGSSLWYAGLAFQRVLFDQLQLAVDPDARTQMRKLEQKYRREQSQNYFWRPGDLLPERMPDIENAIGAQKGSGR